MINIKIKHIKTNHIIDYVVNNTQELLDLIVNDSDDYQHINSLNLEGIKENFDVTNEDERIEYEYILKKIRKAKEEKALIIDSNFNTVVDAEDIMNDRIITESYIYILN